MSAWNFYGVELVQEHTTLHFSMVVHSNVLFLFYTHFVCMRKHFCMIIVNMETINNNLGSHMLMINVFWWDHHWIDPSGPRLWFIFILHSLYYFCIKSIPKIAILHINRHMAIVLVITIEYYKQFILRKYRSIFWL
jgi:hypothetical protein